MSIISQTSQSNSFTTNDWLEVTKDMKVSAYNPTSEPNASNSGDTFTQPDSEGTSERAGKGK